MATPVNSRKIQLDWLDVSSDEDGVQLEGQTWNARYVQLAAVGSDGTTFTDTVGIDPGREQRYRVRAFRAADSSPYSQATAVTPGYVAGDSTWAL